MKFYNIYVQFNFITGMMLGLEFFTDEEDDISYLIIDLLILRTMIIKES